MELVKEPVKTGDILLFDYQDGWISWAIKFFTKSNYSHVGMVVVDPQFTEIPLKEFIYGNQEEDISQILKIIV